MNGDIPFGAIIETLAIFTTRLEDLDPEPPRKGWLRVCATCKNWDCPYYIHQLLTNSNHSFDYRRIDENGNEKRCILPVKECMKCHKKTKDWIEDCGFGFYCKPCYSKKFEKITYYCGVKK